MATPNYSVNYNDKRFQQVEKEEKTALNQSNSMYNEMVKNSDNYYQEMIDASKDYANQQTQIQNQNTQHTINKIEQQKDQAKQDYIKEQKGAYTDYQKASNQYGANAEAMASQGMANTGYSESAQVSMYNTYQNRYMTARDSYNRAVLNYDNSIKDAQLANSSALAEIAYQALQQQLQLSLEGFQYKNTLLQQKLQAQREIDSEYYSRWQNVLSQINTENSLKEQVRQYNEKMAEERRQYNESLAEQRRQYNNTLAFQKAEAQREQANWQKEYNLAVSKANARESYTIKKDETDSDAKKKDTKNSTIKKDTNNTNVKKDTSNNKSTSSTITLGDGTKAYSSAVKAYQASGGSEPISEKGLIEKGLVRQYADNGNVYYYVPSKKTITLKWR